MRGGAPGYVASVARSALAASWWYALGLHRHVRVGLQCVLVAPVRSAISAESSTCSSTFHTPSHPRAWQPLFSFPIFPSPLILIHPMGQTAQGWYCDHGDHNDHYAIKVHRSECN